MSDPQLFEPPEPVAVPASQRPLSQGGSDDRSNLLLCCHACHQWTHANPREARALGFLVFGVDVWSQP